MADIKIKPLGDRVLIEAVEAVEETMGGIFIPDSAKEKPQEARVVALGTGRVDEDGKKITADAYRGKTINVKGIIETFSGESQIKVFSPDDITIVG